MEQDFDLLVQSRANYYTKGSPIQFVRVELLKGSVTGEIAVCLTFKNVGDAPITGLVIHFACKGPEGAVLCEDQFYYEGLNAGKGELFGADEAVFVSEGPVSNVEVSLEQAFLTDGSALPLAEYPRVRLPGPKALPAELAQQLQQRLGKPELVDEPQLLEEGWYCACGAFHPKGEDDVYCSECGCDRILLQNSLSAMQQETAAPALSEDEATRVVSPVPQEEPTRMMPPMTAQEEFAQSYHRREEAQAQLEEDDSDMRLAADPGPAAAPVQEEQEAAPLTPDDPDYLAERIIRWAPPITAGICALIVAIGFIWYQFL